MRSTTRTILTLLAASLLAAATAYGMDHSQGGMTMGTQTAQAAEMKLPGARIAQKILEGYTLTYQLLDKQERDSLMKGMEGMEMPGMSASPDITNHLMVFIKGTDGKPVAGTVGFLLSGPDGKQQKSMTMGTSGGYGADVSFKVKGKYAIRMKAAIGEKTLTDDLTYEMK